MNPPRNRKDETGNPPPKGARASALPDTTSKVRDRNNFGYVLQRACLYYDFFFLFSGLSELPVSFGFNSAIYIFNAESVVASEENSVFLLVTVPGVFSGCYFRREGVNNTKRRSIVSYRFCNSPTIVFPAFPFR